MKEENLTLNQTLFFGQTEFHESVGILQHDLQHAVFTVNLCDFLFDEKQEKILHTSRWPLSELCVYIYCRTASVQWSAQ